MIDASPPSVHMRLNTDRYSHGDVSVHVFESLRKMALTDILCGVFKLSASRS